MFGPNESQKKLYEEWDSMSKDEKYDTFLKKMSWWHSRIDVPGVPPHEAINNLADVVQKASDSSSKLSASIKVATWVGGVAAALGVALGTYNIFHQEVDVSQKVFEECFNYYASIDPEKGIDNSLIQLCKDKAKDW